MSRALNDALRQVCNDLVPFLDLYDNWELAAASRESNRWTQSSPWYRELYLVTPSEYVDIKLYLPPRTFRSIRKLRLSWWSSSSVHGPDEEECIMWIFSQHMDHAKKQLPNLEIVEVYVTLTGDVEDSPEEEWRVGPLLRLLPGIAHVKAIVLDLRNALGLDPVELRQILKRCVRSRLHESMTLALRSTTPSSTEYLCQSHEADKWLLAVAQYLKSAAQQCSSLHFFKLYVEVPYAGPAKIAGATPTSLKVSSAVASALNGRLVQYICEGSSLLRADSGNVPPGPFYASMDGSNLELWDSRENYLNRNRLDSVDGRQKFVAIDSATTNLGCLSLTSPMGRGVAQCESILRALPDLNVELAGSDLWGLAGNNVKLITSPFIPYMQQTDTEVASPSDESSESSLSSSD